MLHIYYKFWKTKKNDVWTLIAKFKDKANCVFSQYNEKKAFVDFWNIVKSLFQPLELFLFVKNI